MCHLNKPCKTIGLLKIALSVIKDNGTVGAFKYKRLH